MGELEKALRHRRDTGGRAFVPYVTGGFDGVDAAFLRALQDAGADAVEVGIPFSDPVMDGGVIQEASRRALEAGTRPTDVFETIRDASLEIPVAVMTYANPVVRMGMESFMDLSRDAGVSGVIVPDMPVDETEELERCGSSRDVDVVLLAAPGTRPARLDRIAARARGFIYCVATYGVTGARESLAGTARELVEALRPRTDAPLLVGVGIGTPEHATEVCEFADGVIVGSALMDALMGVEGDREATLGLARAFRAAIPR